MVEWLPELEESVRTTIDLLNTDKIPIIYVKEWQLLADIKNYWNHWKR